MRNIHVYIKHKKNIRISNKENPFDIKTYFGDLMTVNFSKLKKKGSLRFPQQLIRNCCITCLQELFV